MIVDSLSTISQHPGLDAGLQRCLYQILKYDLFQLEPGTYPIQENLLQLKIVDRQLAIPEEKHYEVHKQFLDIHIPLSASEAIGYISPTAEISGSVPFDEQQDVAFIEETYRPSWLVLAPGDLVIIFPGEWHKPCCTLASSSVLRKAMVKIHRSLLTQHV